MGKPTHYRKTYTRAAHARLSDRPLFYIRTTDVCRRVPAATARPSAAASGRPLGMAAQRVAVAALMLSFYIVQFGRAVHGLGCHQRSELGLCLQSLKWTVSDSSVASSAGVSQSISRCARLTTRGERPRQKTYNCNRIRTL